MLVRLSIGRNLLSSLSYAYDISVINIARTCECFVDSPARQVAETGIFINVSRTEYMATDNSFPDSYPDLKGTVQTKTIYFRPLMQPSSGRYIANEDVFHMFIPCEFVNAIRPFMPSMIIKIQLDFH